MNKKLCAIPHSVYRNSHSKPFKTQSRKLYGHGNKPSLKLEVIIYLALSHLLGQNRRSWRYQHLNEDTAKCWNAKYILTQNQILKFKTQSILWTWKETLSVAWSYDILTHNQLLYRRKWYFHYVLERCLHLNADIFKNVGFVLVDGSLPNCTSVASGA